MTRALVLALVFGPLLLWLSPPQPVAAAGNCSIGQVTFWSGVNKTGSSRTYCYGATLVYGDNDMSSENSSGLMGPLKSGPDLADFDSNNGTSGINSISWILSSGYKFCAWDGLNQPNATQVASGTGTGYNNWLYAYTISSFQMMSSGYSCSSHP